MEATCGEMVCVGAEGVLASPAFAQASVPLFAERHASFVSAPPLEPAVRLVVSEISYAWAGASGPITQ